jgi:hypothetical protein
MGCDAVVAESVTPLQEHSREGGLLRCGVGLFASRTIHYKLEK